MCEIKFGAKLITDSNTSYKAGILRQRQKCNKIDHRDKSETNNRNF